MTAFALILTINSPNTVAITSIEFESRDEAEQAGLDWLRDLKAAGTNDEYATFVVVER